MALTYATFTTSLANIAVIPVNDPNFVAAMPNIIDDAEQRCYRELDLISTVVTDATAALVAGNRNFTLPGGNAFFVIEDINIVTPAGQTNPDLGERHQCLPCSKEMVTMLYPSNAGAGVPAQFARITQSTMVFGPWPDAGYTVEVIGTQRPTPLSPVNQNTFLTQYLPDLFLAAAMIFVCGYQKNFSAMGDNPQSAVSWESHFGALLKSANVEEMRKRFGSEGWSSAQPDPIATPART